MKFVEAQLLVRLARVQQWSAIVSSGAWRQAKTQRACGTNEDGTFQWRDLTDEEKLAAAVSTLGRHVELAQETCDAIGEREGEP